MTHPASLIESISAPPLTSRNKLAVLGWRALPFLILALVTYYALFRLPFHFPPRLRLMSASYAFGFNNSVAILALAAILAILTLIYLLRSRPAGPLPIAFVDQNAAESKRRMRWVFAIVSISYALLTFVMYIYNAHAAPPLMWETRHLLHRTLLMDLYGLRPVHADCGGIWTDSYLCSVRDVLAAQATGRFA